MRFRTITKKTALIVSGLTFRSLIHFEFIFVYGVSPPCRLSVLACGDSLVAVRKLLIAVASLVSEHRL